MTEVASVKDNFRFSGRREESQREVKELDIVFHEAEASGSGVARFLLRIGTAGDGVACSGGVLKSMSVRQMGFRRRLASKACSRTYLILLQSLGSLMSRVPQG